MDTIRPPGPEMVEIRRREIERFLQVAFRVRFLLVPLLLGLLVLFWLFDPLLWKAALTGTLMAGVLGIFTLDLVRLRRHGFQEERLPGILISVFALQGGLIYLTGALESPFLPVFFPVALAAGLALGRPRALMAMMVLPLALLWGMALGVIGGWVPRPTPRFWGLGQGFAHLELYVVVRTGIYSLILVGVAAQGAFFRHMYDRILGRTLAAEQEARETLVQTNRELRSLTGSIAHELKNPLASVQGLAELLERSLPTDSREARRAGVLREAAERMAATLEEFLNLSRPLARPALQPLEPGALLKDLAALHEGLAAQRGIRLDLETPGSPVPPAVWDPRKVRQILANLVINALEAGRPGDRVSLLARPGPAGTVQLVVRDSGPGPAPEVAERLFQAGVTTRDQGSGLGLTVARALASQHGGTLRWRRTDGGCEFELELPLEPPEEPGEDGA